MGPQCGKINLIPESISEWPKISTFQSRIHAKVRVSASAYPSTHSKLFNILARHECIILAKVLKILLAKISVGTNTIACSTLFWSQMFVTVGN
jgi:hypothetical protein